MSSSLAPPVYVNGSGKAPASVKRLPTRSTLTIDALVLRRIVSHMQSCLPIEGVGLLAATRGKDGPIADAYYPGTNVADSPTRYKMDPREVHCAFEEMKRRHTHLGAVIHSHPTTVAEPSPIDLKESTLVDVLSIIVGFEPRLSIRAWRLLFNPSGEAFDAVECPIDVTAPEVRTREYSRTIDEWLKRDT